MKKIKKLLFFTACWLPNQEKIKNFLNSLNVFYQVIDLQIDTETPAKYKIKSIPCSVLLNNNDVKKFDKNTPLDEILRAVAFE